MKAGLKRLIKEQEDSVIIFSSSVSLDYKKEIIGLNKAEEAKVI